MEGSRNNRGQVATLNHQKQGGCNHHNEGKGLRVASGLALQSTMLMGGNGTQSMEARETAAAQVIGQSRVRVPMEEQGDPCNQGTLAMSGGIFWRQN